MVLPLYAVMARLDLSLSDAAVSLGASPVRAFRRVFLPLSLPGLFAGGLLVFVLCLGFYITPALLGGPQDVLIGQLIADQVTTNVRFGFASAIGIVLLVLTLVALAVGARLLRRTGALKGVTG
jgi:putative spermidine/putrescine transport system permease protein